MTNVSIDVLGVEDFEELHALIQEFADYLNLSDHMKNTVELMKKEKDMFKGFVAKQDGKLIGYATYFYTYHTWSGTSIYMDDLFVQEASRAQGVGTALLNRIIEQGRHIEAKSLKWQVTDWNVKAQGFYKSLGASISGEEWNCKLTL